MEYKQITLTEIYIPICFYFNIACIISTSPPLSFTFQYVSILIPLRCILLLSLKYLHSNMFLF